MLRWLLIAVFVVLGWITLSYLAGVLAPILAALGVAYLLNPVLERMCRHGASRALGAALLLITFVVVIAATIGALAPRVADQLTEFVHDIPHMFDNLSTWASKHFGITLPADWKTYAQDHLDVGTAGPLGELASAGVRGVFHLLGVVAEFLLVPVFSYYFLVDWPNLMRRIDH